MSDQDDNQKPSLDHNRHFYCTFCNISAGELPSRKRYEDEQILAFDNQLTWVPTMLLIIPKQHLSQEELWGNGPLLSHMGAIAMHLGQQYCTNGFRVLSNFGEDALQTQQHGHLHVLGGSPLGLYIGTRKRSH